MRTAVNGDGSVLLNAACWLVVLIILGLWSLVDNNYNGGELLTMTAGIY